MADYCYYSGNSNSFIKLMLVMMILMVVMNNDYDIVVDDD